MVTVWSESAVKHVRRSTSAATFSVVVQHRHQLRLQHPHHSHVNSKHDIVILTVSSNKLTMTTNSFKGRYNTSSKPTWRLYAEEGGIFWPAHTFQEMTYSAFVAHRVLFLEYLILISRPTGIRFS